METQSSNHPAQQHSWRQMLRLYLTRRQIVVFCLGLASGAPASLILTTLTYWLATLDIEKSTIGLFLLTTSFYAFKFLWAPLVDRVRLPFLHRLGQRRGWLLLVQILLIASICAIGLSDPAHHIAWTAYAAIGLGFFSATQDIILDAYRIEILDEDEQGAGAAMIQFGWRTGAIITSAGALLLATEIGYPATYVVMSLTILIGLVAAFLWGEPAHVETSEAARLREGVEARLRAHPNPRAWHRAFAWFDMSIMGPFREFMTRRGWWLILIFIVLIKFGDAVAANQIFPFLHDLGFDEKEVAWATKIVGFAATLTGVAVGGLLYYKVGTFWSLVVAGFAMAITNLGYAALAVVGHDLPMMALANGIENFASGVGGTVVVAYLSSLCNRSFTATQYALLSAFALAPRSIFAAFSGFLSEAVDWPTFFIISTLAAIPGLLLLIPLRLWVLTDNRVHDASKLSDPKSSDSKSSETTS